MSTRSGPSTRGDSGAGPGPPPEGASGMHPASASSGTENDKPEVTAAPRRRKVRRSSLFEVMRVSSPPGAPRFNRALTSCGDNLLGWRGMMRRSIAGVVTVLGLLIAGCAEEPASTAGGGGGGGGGEPACDVSDPPLFRAGQLTVATDRPAYPPWFEGSPKNY